MLWWIRHRHRMPPCGGWKFIQRGNTFWICSSHAVDAALSWTEKRNRCDVGCNNSIWLAKTTRSRAHAHHASHKLKLIFENKLNEIKINLGRAFQRSTIDIRAKTNEPYTKCYFCLSAISIVVVGTWFTGSELAIRSAIHATNADDTCLPIYLKRIDARSLIA